jgi:aspartyl-tRNA(Asn)/glutamyl-tRNA(Gln) amidotransferase subunit A
LGTFALRAGHYDKFYGRAQIARRRIAAGLARAFNDVDVIVTPTAPTRAFRIGEMIDDPIRMKLADLYTVTANLAGLPAISLPVSLADGLPTAVQLMAPRFCDARLLSIAEELEAKLDFDGRKCPMAQRGPAIDVGGEVSS